MRAMRLVFAVSLGVAIAVGGLLTGCDRPSNSEETIDPKLYQNWQLKPGKAVAGFTIVAGLGDITIALNGKSAYAPFPGLARKDPRNCIIFSSPDVPAYMFRLCGLSNLRLGPCNQGDPLGSGSLLHLAALRKQPDGTWALVEPSQLIVERILTQS